MGRERGMYVSYLPGAKPTPHLRHNTTRHLQDIPAGDEGPDLHMYLVSTYFSTLVSKSMMFKVR